MKEQEEDFLKKEREEDIVIIDSSWAEGERAKRGLVRW